MIACNEFRSVSSGINNNNSTSMIMSTDESQQQEEKQQQEEVIKCPYISKIDIFLQLGICSLVFLYLNPFDCLDFLMSHPR